MGTYVLIALAVLVASIVIGGLLSRLWARLEQREVGKKWQERERLLDGRRAVAPRHAIHKRHSWPAGTRDVPTVDTAARVLYIVARDQPELFAFLRRDFAPEEVEGAIEILVDRRHGVQPGEVDGRDPLRSWAVSRDLREMGFALVATTPSGSPHS